MSIRNVSAVGAAVALSLLASADLAYERTVSHGAAPGNRPRRLNRTWIFAERECYYPSQNLLHRYTDRQLFLDTRLRNDPRGSIASFLKDVFFGGDYYQFRFETAPYMGVEPGSERMEDIMYNEYTAREFINCLSLLSNESERFPSIVDAMQQAMTDRFFKINEPRFRIAHKLHDFY